MDPELRDMAGVLRGLRSEIDGLWAVFRRGGGGGGGGGTPGPPGPPGAAAGFGTPSASASGLAPGSNPTASIIASGPDTAKVFTFSFGIPAGAQGPPGSGAGVTTTRAYLNWTQNFGASYVAGIAPASNAYFNRVNLGASNGNDGMTFLQACQVSIDLAVDPVGSASMLSIQGPGSRQRFYPPIQNWGGGWTLQASLTLAVSQGEQLRVIYWGGGGGTAGIQATYAFEERTVVTV